MIWSIPQLFATTLLLACTSIAQQISMIHLSGTGGTINDYPLVYPAQLPLPIKLSSSTESVKINLKLDTDAYANPTVLFVAEVAQDGTAASDPARRITLWMPMEKKGKYSCTLDRDSKKLAGIEIGRAHV